MKTFEDIIISLCRQFYVTISHKLGVDYIVINTPSVTENAAKIATENDFPELSFL